MYEHYLYMPIIGFAVLTGFGAVHFRSILGEQRAAIINVSLVLWLLTLSFLSFQRTAVWKDSITLFTDATAKSPDGFRVWKMLGELHRSSGNSEASRVALERCLQLKPDSTDILWALADLYTELGQLDKGKDYLHRLLAIDPKYVMGWSTLGNNYLGSRNFKLAKEMYTNALVLQPDALEVYTLLGKLAVAEKHFDEARANFNVIEADKRHWRLDDNAYQMVRTESLAGRVDEAFVWLEKALLRGYNDYYTLNTNMELSVLWDSPRFAYLMHQYFPEEEKTR
jgi:tetratricopeptide (TPR) repeat protein